MLTYGDGVSDVDLGDLLAFHRAHGKLATVTAVRPPARFGQLEFDGDRVTRFAEKPQVGEGWINGGFFVLEPRRSGPDSRRRALGARATRAAALQPASSWPTSHESFWQCMDTLRDKRLLDSLWTSGRAPWKVWA